MSEQPLTDYEQRLVENVGKYGCHVLSVFDNDDAARNFSYSVGFWETVGQPEVIVLGLPTQMGGFAVNETFRQCQAGLDLSEGQHIDGLFEEFDVTCVARAVDQKYLIPDYFNSAIWYHALRTGRPLDAAMQLVWSYNGFYPWDDDAPAELLEDQPLLYSEARH